MVKVLKEFPEGFTRYVNVLLRNNNIPTGTGMFSKDADSEWEFKKKTVIEEVRIWLGIPETDLVEFQVYVDINPTRDYPSYAEGSKSVGVIAHFGVHRHEKALGTPTTGWVSLQTYKEVGVFRLPRPLLFTEGEKIYVHYDGNGLGDAATVEYRVYLIGASER